MADTLMSQPEMADTLKADTISQILPQEQTLESWKYEAPAEMPDPSVQGWWKGFHDPLLDTLISVAVHNNYDIRMAARRIELNQLGLKSVRSAYFPTIGAEAGWNGSRTSADMGRTHGISTHGNYFNLGLNASWEIDVFGRVWKTQARMSPWVFQGLSSLFFFLRGARFLRASSFFLLSLNQRLLAVVYAVENVIKDATIGEVNL